jgi:D-arabinose 1-dehydrogenase-like Zn-dependent alcohol dehydrogenase
VLVEIKAIGICHTGEFTMSVADLEGLFPAILGHEGATFVVGKVSPCSRRAITPSRSTRPNASSAGREK